MSKTRVTQHPIFKWVVLFLIVLFVYELYKQLKAGAQNLQGGIIGAIAAAGNAVVADVTNMAKTLFTDPIAFLTGLPSEIFSFIGSIFSGLLSNPLALLASLPTLALGFLDNLFGGIATPSALALTPASNQSNAFINGVIPNASTATTSMPSWLTTSPTSALPSLPSVFDAASAVQGAGSGAADQALGEGFSFDSASGALGGIL